MSASYRIGLGFSCVLALGAGCGGSSDGGPDDAGSAQEGGADGAGGEVFVVSVLLAENDAPVNGAAVALDLGGERFQVVTGTDGIASFSGLSFGVNTASVTVYRSGYGLVSYIGLEPRDDVLQIRLPRRSPVPGTVGTIQGTASGMMSTSSQLLVTSTVGVGNDTPVLPPDYEVRVETGTEGHLVALEYEALSGGGPRDFLIEHKQWAVKAHPAVSGLSDIDLSFATDSVTATAVSGTLVLPTRTDSPLRTDSDARITVYTENVNTLVGVIETATLATGQFDLTGRYVVVPGTFEPETIYALRVLEGNVTQELSSVVEFAYPTDGFEIANFLDSPQVTSEVDLARMEDAVTWTSFDSVPLVQVRVTTEDVPPERVWDVYLPEDATSLTFPELPAGAGNVLGSDPLAGRVILCDLDEERNICVRQALSHKIELIP